MNEGEIREGLQIAYWAACDSPDPSTQNGAAMMSANGSGDWLIACNTFPRGVQRQDERLERPLKYQFIEHAERNLVYAAARHGVSCQDQTLFVPWFACSDCARGIIQAGFATVVGHQSVVDLASSRMARWEESIAVAMTMLEEAGVETVLYEGKLDCAPVLFDGEYWNP